MFFDIYAERKKDMRRIFTKIFSMMFLFCTMIFGLLEGTKVSVSAATPSIWYKAHVSDIGWMSPVCNGQVAGTVNRSLQMEALQIDTSGISGGVSYRVHVADLGWLPWVKNRETAGTVGQVRRAEAVSIVLTGEAAKQYDVVYRAHVMDRGWLAWVKNGQVAGTVGEARRMEAVEIRLVKKTSANNQGSQTSVNNSKIQSFINDARWRVGASYGSRETGKLRYSGGSGCYAYCSDYTNYVYNKKVEQGSSYTKTSSIRAGDVIQVLNSQHWMVVLSRTGNNINVIQGNWTGGKVCKSSFRINGNKIVMGRTSRVFSKGYHY